jgi:DNA-binding NarL/FixJ family response regulator
MITYSKNGSTNGKSRILVVDDHPIARHGLAQLVAQESDIEVCGDVDSVADALREADSLRPDLVVADIALKDSRGMELITQLREHHRGTKMLVWSTFDEMFFAERVLRAGAMGYINKQESVERIIEAIRRVLGGEIYLSPRMTNHVLARIGRGESIQQDPISNLTDRELEVFEMIGQGLTTQQIAHQLGLSPKTIETHREKIKAKLDLRNAAELSRRAVQWALEQR